MHRKSSTVRKHLNSMTILSNLNMILLTKKSRRPQTRNIEAQTDIIYLEKYIRCNIQNDIEMYASQKYSDESDNESIDDMDSQFVLSESGTSSCSDFDLNDSKDDTKSTAVIVFWSSLINFFGKCFTSFDKSIKITRKVRGSLLTIMMTCSNGHGNI